MNETEVSLDITAEEWINILGKKYDLDESYYSQCCIKTIGEASFLLGNYKLREYAFINENAIPKLIVLAKDSIGKKRKCPKNIVGVHVKILANFSGMTNISPNSKLLTSLSLQFGMFQI